MTRRLLPLCQWSTATAGDRDHQRYLLSAQTLEQWFARLQALHDPALDPDERFAAAARMVIDPGGLDWAGLLRPDQGGWQLAWTAGQRGLSAQQPLDYELIDQAFHQQRPVVALPTGELDRARRDVAAIALPIFADNRQVSALLYARRYPTHTNRRRTIRHLEALWMQLVAEALTAAVIRTEQESIAARQQRLLEKSLPPEIAARWSEPAGETHHQCRNVTLLFADAARSSQLCQQLCPTAANTFLQDLLDTISAVVIRYRGTVVDTYGDGLIAMWNAPRDQVDHAELACEAALAIAEQSGPLRRRWSTPLAPAVRIQVGVHTGPALVGNSGSQHRIKYGPRGMTVYLAHRIERATRLLNQPVLISEATCRRLPKSAEAYRLGQFQLWGLDPPITLYALMSTTSLHSDELEPTGTSPCVNACCRETFAKVQHLIELGEFLAAAGEMDACGACHQDELSLGFLQDQLTKWQLESHGDQTPVFKLSSK